MKSCNPVKTLKKSTWIGANNGYFYRNGCCGRAASRGRVRSAVATLSNDVDDSLARWLWMVRRVRPVVAVCDNDRAGRKLAKCGTTSHVMEEGKDMGEASDEYVTNFLRNYK